MENSQTNATNAKCGHWVTSLALIPKLITRLSNLGEEKPKNATNVTLHLLRQAISGDQCTHASSQAGELRRHFITHSEEKQIICN